MANPDKRPRPRLLLFILPAAFLVVGATYVRMLLGPEDTGNYKLRWDVPKEWAPVARSPLSLFRYKRPGQETHMRGSVNQVVADFNPTPQLDTEGMANYQMAISDENLKGWTSKRLPDYEPGELRFSIVRRDRKDQTVVVASTVKGNTTVLIFLTAMGKKSGENATAALSDLHALLKSVRLEPLVIDDGPGSEELWVPD